MKTAWHVKMGKANDIRLNVREYRLERMYTSVRTHASNIKDYQEDGVEGDPCKASQIEVNYPLCLGYRQGWHEESQSVVTFESGMHQIHCDDRYSYPTEIAWTVAHTDDDGKEHQVTFHWPVVYAVMEKGEQYRLTFYDENDEPVMSLATYPNEHPDFRCKAGKYMLVNRPLAKKNINGGCLFCDSARYMKENGIIYLACDKYGGKVAETEYTGEEYPAYCKKRK